MPKLTYSQREKLSKNPKKNFAMPAKKAGEKDKYPVVDARGRPSRSRAANAKARATQMYKKGKLSAENRAKINKKANQALYKSKSKSDIKNMSVQPKKLRNLNTSKNVLLSVRSERKRQKGR